MILLRDYLLAARLFQSGRIDELYTATGEDDDAPSTVTHLSAHRRRGTRR